MTEKAAVTSLIGIFVTLLGPGLKVGTQVLDFHVVDTALLDEYAAVLATKGSKGFPVMRSAAGIEQRLGGC